jgi:signal transduction histidine kinase
MMHSLRWKLVLMAVVIVFIPVYLLNRYAITFFDRYTRTDLEAHMRHYAFIAGEQYKLFLVSESAPSSATSGTNSVYDGLARLYTRMGTEIHAHVHIVGMDGRILFDSEGTSVGGDLRDRPEISEALRGGYSARSRLTEDRQFMYYFVARPIKDDQKNVLGVAYVIAHTNPIVQAIKRMVANQRLATYIALACAGLVATVLALAIARRLRGLMRETRAFAAGRRPLGAPPRGGDEIAELGQSIHRMADEIESRNGYNRDFIQTTLHELKTPLTAIRGAAEVLESLGQGTEDGMSAVGPAKAEGRRTEGAREKFLGIIGFQVNRLMQLVGELRELTRVDVELARAPREEIDYARFVQDAIGRLADTFSEPHAELIAEVQAKPLPLRIVPGRIEQVLANLLDNAFRYTPVSGQVTVRVEDGDLVQTTVSDTGCGIAPSNLDRVFDRFFTTERRQRPQDYGSGLGLAIAASIVRHHRGEIRVTSTQGEGTCFTFELPRHI